MNSYKLIMNADHSYKATTEAVMERIAKRRLVRARAGTLSYGAVIIAALGAIVPAVQYVLASAAQSGFLQYLSLVASDGGSLATYWKDFVLTIVETAPLMAGALVLGIALVFAYSVRKMAGSISRLRVAVV